MHSKRRVEKNPRPTSQARGSLVLSLQEMAAVQWHAAGLSVCGEHVRHAFSAEGGAQFWQIYNAAQAHGRFVVGGECCLSRLHSYSAPSPPRTRC